MTETVSEKEIFGAHIDFDEGKKKDNHYLVDIICDNCSHSKHYLIPKGMPVRKYLKNEKCKKCECHIIKQKVKKNVDI